MLDGARDAEKQMLVLEQRQHVQETRDPDGAHEQRERNVCFLHVSFKWGGEL